MLVLYMAGKKENKPTKTTTLNVTFFSVHWFHWGRTASWTGCFTISTKTHLLLFFSSSHMPVSQTDDDKQVGKPSRPARLAPPKVALCDPASHFSHRVMREIHIYKPLSTHTPRFLQQQLLPWEKECQSYLTSAAKLKLPLAPPQDGSVSWGAAATWPKIFLKQTQQVVILTHFVPATFS